MARSVLGEETFGPTNACDSATLIQHDLKKMLKNTLEIQVLADSETLLIVIIRNSSTTEKRLMIDVMAVREAYKDGIIDDIICIRRNFNL